jgi:hypothetical protein
VAAAGAAPQVVAIAPAGGIVIALNGNGLLGGAGGTGGYLQSQNGLAGQPVILGDGLSFASASNHRMDRGAGQGFGFSSGGYAAVQLGGNSTVASTWMVSGAGGAVQYIDGPPAGMLTIGVANLGLASNNAGDSEFGIPDVIRLTSSDGDSVAAGTLAIVGVESGGVSCGTLSGGNWGVGAPTDGNSDATLAATTGTTSASGTGSCSNAGLQMGSGTGNWFGNGSGNWSVSLPGPWAGAGVADDRWSGRAILFAWGSGSSLAHEALELESEPVEISPDFVTAPEPSSLVIAGTAIGLLARRRRRIF